MAPDFYKTPEFRNTLLYRQMILNIFNILNITIHNVHAAPENVNWARDHLFCCKFSQKITSNKKVW